MSFLAIGATLGGAVATFLTIYAHWKRGIFRKMGVPYGPTWPFLGSLPAYSETCIFEVDAVHLAKYGANDCKVVGIFEGREPVLLIADPDMIRNVLLVQSNHFYDIDLGDPECTILQHSLTSLTGADWKRARQALSPAFTPSNLGKMAIIVSKHADIMVEDIKSKYANCSADVTELARSYMVEAFVAIALGIDLRRSPAEIERLIIDAGKDILATPNEYVDTLIDVFGDLALFFVRIFHHLGIKPRETKGIESFERLVRTEIKRREDNKSRNDDLLQLLLEKETANAETTATGLNRDETVAHVVAFLIQGCETPASLAFFIVAMAQNPDCQKRLRQELAEVQSRSTGQTSIDQLESLPYLNMCIMETLRYYPADYRTNRVCTATEGATMGGIQVPQGLTVGIPIAALHKSAEFWSEPEKFDPLRFSDGVPKNATFAYLPFGAGHRNCIGERLAKMVMKIAIAAIFSKYHVELGPDFEEPIRLEQNGLRIPEQPLLIQFLDSPPNAN